MCECCRLAQREYEKKHGKYRKIQKDTLEVYRKIGFKVNEKWYKHEPEKLVENDSARYYRMLQFKPLISLR